jgi:hypothetical protein
MAYTASSSPPHPAFDPSFDPSWYTIRLTDGRRFEIAHDDDTWYVIIDGRFYCAAKREDLLRGVEEHFHVRHPQPPPAPDKHPLQIAAETLKSSTSSLIDRQAARNDLKRFASAGDVAAKVLLQDLSNKPALSPRAQTITARLKKDSFEDVTHEELVQHVNDLVLRSVLILELSDRLRF